MPGAETSFQLADEGGRKGYNDPIANQKRSEGDGMTSVLCVGAGGFIGAVLRYGAGFLVPAAEFPLSTFLVNLLGAVLIGAVVEVAERGGALSPNAVLFLKTGLCGGFTTFSTFSLETLNLLEGGQVTLGIGYAAVSVVCCVVGVVAGRLLVRAVFAHAGLAE